MIHNINLLDNNFHQEFIVRSIIIIGKNYYACSIIEI